MSSYSQSGPASTFVDRRLPSLRAVFVGAVARVRASRTRRKQHRELLDYLASDHRAAADIGITNYNECELRR